MFPIFCSFTLGHFPVAEKHPPHIMSARDLRREIWGFAYPAEKGIVTRNNGEPIQSDLVCVFASLLAELFRKSVYPNLHLTLLHGLWEPTTFITIIFLIFTRSLSQKVYN